MDGFINQLKNQKRFGYTIIILSIVVLLFNRVFAFPFDWLLVAVAIVGIFIGANFFERSYDAKYKYLKQSGTQIQAKFLYVSLQATPNQFGSRGTASWQAPYLANFQVVCEGVDPTNQSKKIYFSDRMTSHPDLKLNPSSTFRVYVDKNDSSFYWVDLSEVSFDNNFPSIPFTLSANFKSYDGVNYQKA